jgi:hypothetical protein
VSVLEELDFDVSLELEELDGVVLLLELGVVLELDELGVVELELVELGVVDWLEVVELLELGVVELGVVDISVLCDLLRVDLLHPVRHSPAAMSVVALTSLIFCRLISFFSQGFVYFEARPVNREGRAV